MVVDENKEEPGDDEKGSGPIGNANDETAQNAQEQEQQIDSTGKAGENAPM